MNTSDYDAIYRHDHLNLELVENIISNSFSSPNGVISYISPINSSIESLPSKLRFNEQASVLRCAFRASKTDILNSDGINHLKNSNDGKLSMSLVDNIWIHLMEFIVSDRTVKTSINQSDLYRTDGTIEINNGTAIVTVPFLYPKVLAQDDISHVDEATIELIESDFLDHFSKFEEFIKWVVAMRVSTIKKASMLHLNPPSDWGKSFLLGVFENLGLCIKTDPSAITKALTGGPTALSPPLFLHGMVLAFDEIKRISNEMKDLGKTIGISPKYELRTLVQLHAKILCSHDPINQLIAEGVEIQFANRISYWGPKELGTDTLVKREVYIKYTSIYHSVIVNMAQRLIVGELDKYKQLGKLKGEAEATRFTTEFHEQYRYDKAFDSLDSKLPEHLQVLISELATWAEYASNKSHLAKPSVAIGHKVGEELNRHSKIVTYKNELYVWIQKPRDLITAYVDSISNKETFLKQKVPQLTQAWMTPNEELSNEQYVIPNRKCMPKVYPAPINDPGLSIREKDKRISTGILIPLSSLKLDPTPTESSF